MRLPQNLDALAADPRLGYIRLLTLLSALIPTDFVTLETIYPVLSGFHTLRPRRRCGGHYELFNE